MYLTLRSSVAAILLINIIVALTDITLLEYKESWTDYLHTWNMEGYSFSVIMGDMTLHNSGLRKVSLQMIKYTNICKTILWTPPN